MNTYPSHKNAPLQILSDFNSHIYIYTSERVLRFKTTHGDQVSVHRDILALTVQQSVCVHQNKPCQWHVCHQPDDFSTNGRKGSAIHITQTLNRPTKSNKQLTSQRIISLELVISFSLAVCLIALYLYSRHHKNTALFGLKFTQGLLKLPFKKKILEVTAMLQTALNLDMGLCDIYIFQPKMPSHSPQFPQKWGRSGCSFLGELYLEIFVGNALRSLCRKICTKTVIKNLTNAKRKAEKPQKQ